MFFYEKTNKTAIDAGIGVAVNFGVQRSIGFQTVKNADCIFRLDFEEVFVILETKRLINVAEFIYLLTNHFISKTDTQTVGINNYLEWVEFFDDAFEFDCLAVESLCFSLTA